MKIIPTLLLKKLVEKKIITEEEAYHLEFLSLQKNISIEDLLIKEKKIDKKIIYKTIAEIKGFDYIDLSSIPIDSQAISLISENIARKYDIFPYKYDPKKSTIYIATCDPENIFISDFLEKKTRKSIKMILADKEQIRKSINLSYSQGLSPEIKEALKDFVTNEEKKVSYQDISIKEAPIAKIVLTILEFATKSRASDIHIEPEENRTKVRYRIDGILHEKLSLPKIIHNALISRIKILSEMKIDEKRIPQDGRFNFKLNNEEVDLRVSTLPTVNGEKVVIRLLKKTGGIPTLNELGLRGTQLKDLEESIIKPHGIILITGPTGSGKTTTLYSILSKLNKPSVNIMTLEDPVEYQIPGINQVQINPQAGLTFATGLRSFLRQDPNIILVGEIRDKETTQLAIQAALTGHLVFSTLHTNDAATAIPRLIDLGAEKFLISSVLTCVVAQRIVRRICPYCKITYQPEKVVEENIKTVLDYYYPKIFSDKPLMLTKGLGCTECNNTGYLGRIAIFEVLKISSSINRLILQQASAKDIEEMAKKEGLITMKQDGYLKVLDGITTIEEVLRVAEM